MTKLLDAAQCVDGPNTDIMASATAVLDDPTATPDTPTAPNAVVKALTLLDALGTGRAGEALSTLAARTCLPKSTVCRLLKTMEAQGFVARRGQLYCLGARVSELGRRAGLAEHADLHNLSLGVLEGLVQDTRATVHLAVLSGSEVLVLEKITAAGGGRIPTRVGLTVPAGCTALGKAQLAFSDRRTVEAAVHAPRTAPTPAAARTVPELMARLGEVRKTGVAVDREEFRTGVTCVAAPVIARGRLVAAISASSVGAAGNLTTRTRLVRAAAARLSDLVGRTTVPAH